MAELITTLGPLPQERLGTILPHEHVFVDLRKPDAPGFAEADAGPVVALMAPEVAAVQAQRVAALVECTPVGVGRRVDLVRAVSDATGFPIVVATGIYREPWIPEWALAASEDAIAEWMLGELQAEVETSGVRAAWIKVSAGDDGITAQEAKILRAAARAGRATGAVIGSHTIRGRVVKDQLAIIAAAGYAAERFISIHTQAEPDTALHLEIARRGAWIEYDGIGGTIPDETYISNIHRVLDAGLGDRLLLSQDRGWYDPAKPGGGTPKPWTYLIGTFLPKLAESGVDAATIARLTADNPFRAFAR